MKFGLCTGVENLPVAERLGFDYVECSLTDLAGRSDEEFAQLMQLAAEATIPVSKCNCLLPWEVRVTGPEADESVQRHYLKKAFSRAHQLGVKLVVFGSGGARQVPEGWLFDEAYRQIGAFLCLLAEYGDRYDISVAIEPLRRQESNVINLVGEGLILVSMVNHPRIGVLGDTFHMLSSREPWQALANAGEKLLHLHISHALEDLSGRVYPTADDGGEHAALFDVLRSMNYAGDISIEAGYQDLEKEGAEALKCLKDYQKG